MKDRGFRRAVVAVLCVWVLVGCEEAVVNCSPSPNPVSIDLAGIQPRSALVRSCVGDRCDEFRAMTEMNHFVGVFHRDLPAAIRLEVSVGGRVQQTYLITDLNLRKPSGKGCDPGESVELVPAAGGKLEVAERYDSEG